MKDYKTIRYATSNENGRQELALELLIPFWERVVMMLKARSLDVPKYRETLYEVRGTYWALKGTKEAVDAETQLECFEAKGWVKLNSVNWTQLV